MVQETGIRVPSEGATWSSNEAPVIWDYAGTPRLVDVPLTALAHMCVPIDPAWNLDGVPLTGTCYPERRLLVQRM